MLAINEGSEAQPMGKQKGRGAKREETKEEVEIDREREKVKRGGEIKEIRRR